MRAIKFRAKPNYECPGVEWVYGGYYHATTAHVVVADDGTHWQVGPATVGQFTGLLDKDGKEIYEGDRVQHADGTGSIGVIQFAQGHFGVNWQYEINRDPEWSCGSMYGGWGSLTNLRNINDGLLLEFIIIGTIHDEAKP